MLNIDEIIARRALAGSQGRLNAEGSAPPLSPEDECIALADHLADFNRSYKFRPGQIVRLKPGIAGPGGMGISIVVGYLRQPIYIEASDNPGEQGAYLDIRLAVRGDRGLCLFAVESALIEPYDASERQELADVMADL